MRIEKRRAFGQQLEKEREIKHFGFGTCVSERRYLNVYQMIHKVHKDNPEIEIKRDLINRASRHDIRKGPIALALGEHYNKLSRKPDEKPRSEKWPTLPYTGQVRVNQFFTLFGYHPTIEFENSPALRKWIDKYDKGIVVPECSITLEFNSPLENYVVLF